MESNEIILRILGKVGQQNENDRNKTNKQTKHKMKWTEKREE